jgi:hypothetical protein
LPASAARRHTRKAPAKFARLREFLALGQHGIGAGLVARYSATVSRTDFSRGRGAAREAERPRPPRDLSGF